MPLIYILIIGFLITLFLIPLFKKLAFTYHLYDEGSGDPLKIHQRSVPYIGGLGIIIAFIINLIIFSLLGKISLIQSLGLILASLLIGGFGFLDDLRWKKTVESKPSLKLATELILGFIIALFLIKIGVDFQFSIGLFLGALLIVFYILGAMNAVNMADGMDGLAGGLVFISLIGFVILSLATNNILGLILSFSVLGGVLAFLIYNFPPASIFMGDSGSHFLGFILGILAILFTGHPFYNLKWFLAPILILGLLVFDEATAISRRLIHGQSPFLGDRKHFYDFLHLKIGLSPRKTILICYLIQVIFVIGGLLILK